MQTNEPIVPGPHMPGTGDGGSVSDEEDEASDQFRMLKYKVSEAGGQRVCVCVCVRVCVHTCVLACWLHPPGIAPTLLLSQGSLPATGVLWNWGLGLSREGCQFVCVCIDCGLYPCILAHAPIASAPPHPRLVRVCDVAWR